MCFVKYYVSLIRWRGKWDISLCIWNILYICTSKVRDNILQNAVCCQGTELSRSQIWHKPANISAMMSGNIWFQLYATVAGFMSCQRIGIHQRNPLCDILFFDYNGHCHTSSLFHTQVSVWTTMYPKMMESCKDSELWGYQTSLHQRNSVLYYTHCLS